MGTPAFAASVLTALIENKSYEIVAIVTQPDRPIGRTKQYIASAVKEVALRHGLPLFQPYSLKYDYSLLPIVDFIITCAYGQLLPRKVLNLAKIAAINIHASLLPKLRGGVPIQRAILNNESKTGVTIMEMTDVLDAGPIYKQSEVTIDLNDDLDSLSGKLATAACALLLESLPQIARGALVKQVQDVSAVTYGLVIKREDERINWHKSALEIHNQVRALNPVPGAYTTLGNLIIKIWETSPSNFRGKSPVGKIIIDGTRLLVAALDETFLEIKVLQVAGKKRIAALDFIHSLQNKKWSSFQ